MYNNDQMLKAIEAYKNGYSLIEASKEFGVSQTTLNRRCKKAGILRAYTNKNYVATELQNKAFGKFVALEPIVETDGRVMWNCQCVCGNKQKFRQTKLLQNLLTECLNCIRTGEKNSKWKGCGQLKGTHWKNIKQNVYRRENRVLEFSISIEYAWELYQKQNGKCALTGMEIPMPKKVIDGFVASLDRIDSSKGYIKGNIQWVHKDINVMKWDHPQDHFVYLCKLVTEHSRKKS